MSHHKHLNAALNVSLTLWSVKGYNTLFVVWDYGNGPAPRGRGSCLYFIQAMQRAVTLNPADHTHWSALGVIASHPGDNVWSAPSIILIKN